MMGFTTRKLKEKQKENYPFTVQTLILVQHKQQAEFRSSIAEQGP